MSRLHLLLHRVDPSRNMARYYVLSIEQTLFGEFALVREWGRIGSPGARRSDVFTSGEGAQMALKTWLKRKRSRGYRLRNDAYQKVSV